MLMHYVNRNIMPRERERKRQQSGRFEMHWKFVRPDFGIACDLEWCMKSIWSQEMNVEALEMDYNWPVTKCENVKLWMCSAVCTAVRMCVWERVLCHVFRMPDNGSDCVGSLNSFFDLFFIVLIWVHIHWLIFQTECRLQTYKYPAAEAAPAAAARWMVFVVISVLVHYCFLLTEAHTNTQFLLLLGSNVSYPFFPLSSQSLFLIFFFSACFGSCASLVGEHSKTGQHAHTHTNEEMAEFRSHISLSLWLTSQAIIYCN